MQRPVDSQVPILKIEDEAERPAGKNPLAKMRRGIAVAEPKILNEIRERATRPIRTKAHSKDFDVKTGLTPHVFCRACVFFFLDGESISMSALANAFIEPSAIERIFCIFLTL
jgi:hypothetical protein